MSISKISPAQIRAARELAKLSQTDVVALTGLSLSTIRRVESERKVPASQEAIATIRAALEVAGVQFAGGRAPGVRLRPKP